MRAKSQPLKLALFHLVCAAICIAGAQELHMRMIGHTYVDDKITVTAGDLGHRCRGCRCRYSSRSDSAQGEVHPSSLHFMRPGKRNKGRTIWRDLRPGPALVQG